MALDLDTIISAKIEEFCREADIYVQIPDDLLDNLIEEVKEDIAEFFVARLQVIEIERALYG